MRIMIDTNVVLDVLLRRAPFFDTSKAVLRLCEERKAEGFISASAVTDLFYLARKALGNLDDTYRAIGSVMNIVKILTVTNDDVIRAFQMKAKDFEDCLLAVCAQSNRCGGIVTRNEKDFLAFGIALYTPEEFLSLF